MVAVAIAVAVAVAVLDVSSHLDKKVSPSVSSSVCNAFADALPSFRSLFLGSSLMLYLSQCPSRCKGWGLGGVGCTWERMHLLIA